MEMERGKRLNTKITGGASPSRGFIRYTFLFSLKEIGMNYAAGCGAERHPQGSPPETKDDIKPCGEHSLHDMVIPGRKYSITLSDIFGGTFDVIITAIEFKQYGYNLPSGAWGLYGEIDTTPAEFLVCKIYRKKKKSSFNVNKILKIREVITCKTGRRKI